MFNNSDCTILGLADANSKALLDFKYNTNLIDGINHRYRQELKVTISSVTFKYYQLYVMEVIDYINMNIARLICGDTELPPSKSQQKVAAENIVNDINYDIENDIETKLFYKVA
eukprot:47096_1